VKILIEPSGYALTNMGDVSMLQAAVERIKVYLPAAELCVVTTAPERLQKFCPGCRAVDAANSALWRSLKILPCPHRAVGERLKRRVRDFDAEIRFHFPRLAIALIRANALGSGTDVSGLKEFQHEIRTSDAVVATGGGYFTDSFLFGAEGILDTLRLARHFGKPIAIFGQGLGPLSDGMIKNGLRKILQTASVIGLREKRRGPQFLKSLGVSSNQMFVTGDDALELAAQHAPHQTGSALGFNVRVAAYSGVSTGQFEFFHALLRILARELHAPVLALPIETKPEDSDVNALRKFIPPEISENVDFVPSEPAEVIRQIARCRVVISGSYHAAVFALAMGIPTVCLVKSEYYTDKFLGLQAQFGPAMAVIELQNSNAATVLLDQVRALWIAAESSRDALLHAAQEQIAQGRRAYERFFGRFQ
jgi:colanic acid/amylovoran biosynthesis protein